MQRPREQLGELRPRHADELPRRAGRVGQRAEQVERRPDAERRGAPAPRAASTGGTSARRRTRCPPRARQRSTTAGGAVTRTPSASNTSALPGQARHRSVAVLGDAHAARRDDQRRARRDVERARIGRRRCRRCRTRRRSAATAAPHARASCARGRRSPSGRSPFIARPIEQPGDLRRRGAALHDLGHRRGRLVAREVFVARQLFDQRRKHGSVRAVLPGNCAGAVALAGQDRLGMKLHAVHRPRADAAGP